MTPTSERMNVRTTLTPVLLAVTGVLFVVYPVVRPYSDETSSAGAVALGSAAWIASHVFAMVGFVLLGLVMLFLGEQLAATPGQRPARVATVLTWVGVGLTLPYYGAEAFGLNAIAERAVRDDDVALLELADPVRYGPVQAVMFGGGLLLLAAGAIAAAVAVRRYGLVPSWSGVPLAVGLALFIPQFFGPPSLRIAHGVLVGIGCLLLAWSIRRQPRA